MEGSAIEPRRGSRQSQQPEVRFHGDPSMLRISDADRNKVAEVLRQAAGDGRIDFDELDERLDATFAAKTYADLVPITLDLPAHVAQHESARDHLVEQSGHVTPAHRSGVPAATMHDSTWVVMGESKRRGAWLVPERHAAFALMGTVLLDLREASFAGPHVTITAGAIMGEVRVLVDAHTHVVLDGIPIMGEFTQGKDKTPARLGRDSPTVSIKGFALMGSVTVERQPPPGTPRKFLGTY